MNIPTNGLRILTMPTRVPGGRAPTDSTVKMKWSFT